MSCFGMAPTWPCVLQRGKLWSSYPLGGQALLPAFLHSLLTDLLHIYCAHLQVLTAWSGRTMLNK